MANPEYIFADYQSELASHLLERIDARHRAVEDQGALAALVAGAVIIGPDHEASQKLAEQFGIIDIDAWRKATNMWSESVIEDCRCLALASHHNLDIPSAGAQMGPGNTVGLTRVIDYGSPARTMKNAAFYQAESFVRAHQQVHSLLLAGTTADIIESIMRQAAQPAEERLALQPPEYRSSSTLAELEIKQFLQDLRSHCEKGLKHASSRYNSPFAKLLRFIIGPGNMSDPGQRQLAEAYQQYQHNRESIRK